MKVDLTRWWAYVGLITFLLMTVSILYGDFTLVALVYWFGLIPLAGVSTIKVLKDLYFLSVHSSSVSRGKEEKP